MKVVRKFFMDCDKEETWLNEMSDKGLAQIGGAGSKYVFENSSPGEYIYRIVWLEHDPNHPASLEYLQFLKGTDIEHITSDINWVYLRKKSANGAFEVYSDRDSKIKHYQKASIVSAMLAFGFALISLLSVCTTLVGFYRDSDNMIAVLMMALAVITGVVGVWLLKKYWYPFHKKIRKLKEDKVIME